MSHPHLPTTAVVPPRTPADALTNMAVTVALAEYVALKNEQVSKMENRDKLVYATLVVIGTVAFTATQTGQPVFLLGIPFAAAVLGWIRVSLDVKVEAIRFYLRTTLAPFLGSLVGNTKVLGWESQATGGRRSKYIHTAADLLLFVVSSFAAIAVAAPTLAAHLGLYAGLAFGLLVAFPGALGWEIVRNAR